LLEGASIISVPITVQGTDAVVHSPGGQGVHHIFDIVEIPANASNEVALRITTNETPNFVWISIGAGRYLQASRTSEGGGQAFWEVTYRPTQFVPHTIQVSANAQYLVDQHIATQSFSVNLVAPFVPVAAPRITSVSARPTTIDAGDRTTVTIRTNLDAEHVWLEVDGRRVNARRGNSTATTRTWTAEVRPDRTQNVRIYANATNVEQGAATDTVRITVRDRTDSNARIISATLRATTIRHGDVTYIDVRTNDYVTNVWATIDGARVVGSQHDRVAGHRYWNIRVWAHESQTIRVYASTTNHVDDADVRTVSLTVN
jgi:hypothetical protein